MTVGEIFRGLAEHMLDGVMVHSDLSTYYLFLGLDGYSQHHEYQMTKEYCGYYRLCRYYMEHYNKIIPKHRPEHVSIMPDGWYSHSRLDVDAITKRNSVRSGLEKWVDWERKTKAKYQQAHKDLTDIGEVAAACFICDYIQDVDDELSVAESYLISKKATDYNIVAIEDEQRRKSKKYKGSIAEVGKMFR